MKISYILALVFCVTLSTVVFGARLAVVAVQSLHTTQEQ